MRPLLTLVLIAQLAFPWGPRAHTVVNRAAVQSLPADGPAFLKAHEDWIAYWAPIPDTWRAISEPNSKILEDPNHGWFQEQFSFLKVIPRSRYEFVLALYDEHQRIKAKDPARAALTNVRWTGTLPYAAIESYEHLRIAMRRYRLSRDDRHKAMLELEIAAYLGRLGHYIADAAMPLHVSIHHDGWVGDNPRNFTRDPRIHGRFETQFVDLIELTESDFKARIAPPRHLRDPWQAILAHIAMSFSHVEEVYALDQLGAYTQKDHQQARNLVYKLMAASSELLRDLACTAWIESAQRPGPAPNPILPTHPNYNPATGTAPPNWIPAHKSDTIPPP